MNYTVQQLAKLAGISVRTLHYYDQIGLLKPSRIESNGYRRYEKKDLLRLQQILFFRELEFTLKEIRRILDSQDYDRKEALKEQKHMLELKRKRLDKIISTLSNTLSTMDNNIQDDQLFGGFTQTELETYQAEAKKRWGHTKAWKQSQERMKNWTQKDMERIQKESQDILLDIASHREKGANSAKVQEAVARYHAHMGNFYDCSVETFRGLGQMYSNDPRFKAFYEKIQPGLAAFLTEAIEIYCG